MLEIKDVAVSFGGKMIFENINLKIERGEKVLITGRSGSGKSTILKTILGFILPEKGTILFEGEKINKKNILDYRNKIAYISQGVDFREEKLGSLIKEIFSYRVNREKAPSKQQIEECLGIFGLNYEAVEKKVSELSGGEKQRAGIAVALLLQRKIFLLDEITASLDKEMKKRVADYFAESEFSVVAVSHDSEWRETGKFRVVEI